MKKLMKNDYFVSTKLCDLKSETIASNDDKPVFAEGEVSNSKRCIFVDMV